MNVKILHKDTGKIRIFKGVKDLFFLKTGHVQIVYSNGKIGVCNHTEIYVISENKLEG